MLPRISRNGPSDTSRANGGSVTLTVHPLTKRVRIFCSIELVSSVVQFSTYPNLKTFSRGKLHAKSFQSFMTMSSTQRYDFLRGATSLTTTQVRITVLKCGLYARRLMTGPRLTSFVSSKEKTETRSWSLLTKFSLFPRRVVSDVWFQDPIRVLSTRPNL